MRRGGCRRSQPLLPVAVPAPVRLGTAGLGYPFPWAICPWLEGVPVLEVAVSDRAEIAADLAAAHLALHVPAPDDAPPNPVRGGPLVGRTDAFRERLASGLVPSADRLESSSIAPVRRRPMPGRRSGSTATRIRATCSPSASGAGARLAALIDFGDITAGDPATDLAIAWLAFDQAGRDRYRGVLADAGLDAATWLRAHGWAVALTTVFLAHSADNPAMASVGAHALEQVLADPPA